MRLENVIEKIADERSIESERIENIIENAFEEAAQEKYGEKYNFEAQYDPDDGISLQQNCEVTQDPENPYTQITQDPGNWKEGDELVFPVHIEEPEKQQKLQEQYGSLVEIPEVEEDFNRIAIQRARRRLSEELDKINKERAHKLYKDQIGSIVSGRVRYISDYDIAVDLGKTKAVLPQRETLPDEAFEEGDHVTALIKDVNPPEDREQIILSRTDSQFVAAMFEKDVEEIRNGRIEIKDVVREAGRKTKMSVLSQERGLSSVGPCIGRDGARVMNISNKLGGERIDIVPYTDSLTTYAENALGDDLTVLYSEKIDTNEVLVKVPESEMGKAIGKNGTNIRLASKLIGAEIELDSMEIGVTEE